MLDYGRRVLRGGVGGAAAGGAVGCVSIGSGVGATGVGDCPWPSRTERTCEADCDMNVSTNARNKKIPAVHHVAFVSSVVA